MARPLAQLRPGSVVTLHLAGGAQRRGLVMGVDDGWVQVMGEEGAALVNLAQVVVIDLAAGPAAAESPIDAPRPRPVSKDVPYKVGSKAPARPWSEADLVALADGFLEGRSDDELMRQHLRSRTQLRELRQGFECARGTLTDDDISPVARTWVERWRRALAKR